MPIGSTSKIFGRSIFARSIEEQEKNEWHSTDAKRHSGKNVLSNKLWKNPNAAPGVWRQSSFYWTNTHVYYLDDVCPRGQSDSDVVLSTRSVGLSLARLFKAGTGRLRLSTSPSDA